MSEMIQEEHYQNDQCSIPVSWIAGRQIAEPVCLMSDHEDDQSQESVAEGLRTHGRLLALLNVGIVGFCHFFSERLGSAAGYQQLPFDFKVEVVIVMTPSIRGG